MRYHFLRIGIDNVDSYWGGCTTHFGYLVVKKILSLGGYLVDYPRLIRLNPDIPWKTRGNGCVAIDLMMPKNRVKEFVMWIKEFLLDYIDVIEGASSKNQPAIVIIDGDKLDAETLALLHKLYKRAVCSVVAVTEAINILKSIENKILLAYYPMGPRGLVGALSALGNLLISDYTYELLIYRKLSERDRERFIHIDDKIFEILLEREDTFANVDHETQKILITPAGPDPVIAGIRGDTITGILSTFRKLEKYINYDGWMIFVTNQGTNENFLHSKDREIDYYTQVLLEMRLTDMIHRKGGHISIEAFYNHDRFLINFYQESGRMRWVIKKLAYETKIYIGGGIKPNKQPGETDKVINPQIVYMPGTLINIIVKARPICPSCKVTLKSGGKGNIYKCKKCGYTIPGTETSINKTKVLPTLLLPPYRSILHISKPLKRIGREKSRRFYGIKKMLWIKADV